jgi:hypothetical protein
MEDDKLNEFKTAVGELVSEYRDSLTSEKMIEALGEVCEDLEKEYEDDDETEGEAEEGTEEGEEDDDEKTDPPAAA